MELLGGCEDGGWAHSMTDYCEEGCWAHSAVDFCEDGCWAHLQRLSIVKMGSGHIFRG